MPIRKLLASPALAAGLFLLPIQNLAQSPVPSGEAVSAGLTVEHVITLFQSGVAEDVIIKVIEQNARPFDLTVDQLLELNKANVSSTIIKAMLDPAEAQGAEATKGEMPQGWPSGLSYTPPVQLKLDGEMV